MRALTSSWQFWALLSALFAALTALFQKVGVARIAPEYATFLRVVVILLFSAALAWATGALQPLRSLEPRTLLFLGLSGLATGASWLCYARALKLGPASHVAPLDKLSVVLVAFLGVFFLGERLSASAWAGVGLIAAGALLVAAQG